MFLFLVKRTGSVGYDQYDSFVIVAESEKDAQRTHPSDSKYKWCDDTKQWLTPEGEKCYSSSWVGRLEDVKATKLGKADKGIKPGFICRSYNAG